jgi:O-antigen ligase
MSEMNFDKSPGLQFLPSVLGGTAAAYCFLVLYAAITSFDRPTPWYHAQVSYELILAASVLFLPFMFGQGWRLERLVSNWRPWLAVCLGLGLATIFSVDPVVSLPRLRLIYSVVLIGFMFRAWFARSDGSVIAMVMLAFAMVHAVLLALVLVAYDRASGDLGEYNTWLPYHSHIRHLGYHGTVAASAGLAFSLLVPRFRLVGLFLSTLALFGLIYFGSRGALLTWIVFVSAAVFFGVDRKRLLLTAIVTLFVAWLAATSVGSFKAKHIGTVADRSVSTASVDSRLHLWQGALQAIKERPLFGYGPEGYQTSRCCAPGHVQAHNAVLQITIECGVIGLLAFAWLAKLTIGDALIRLYRQKKSGDAIIPGRALVASLIVSLLAYSMVDGILYHVVPLLILSILCALLFSIRDGGDALGKRASQ